MANYSAASGSGRWTKTSHGLSSPEGSRRASKVCRSAATTSEGLTRAGWPSPSAVRGESLRDPTQRVSQSLWWRLVTAESKQA